MAPACDAYWFPYLYDEACQASPRLVLRYVPSEGRVVLVDTPLPSSQQFEEKPLYVGGELRLP